ncbi:MULTISPECIES: SsrA-binding protein SmpB [Planktothricoides]|jgi:SsrA-binding protein|uniref:SsrA-binding protein n=2 Tax=Planktothricoides raciborskii TaxID=132608 RepID=A0AAU8JIG6_9CYAN|nr:MULTISPECIES: SsrA-binding protein SmpB [Planktothricoides]KOR37004.1 single-stranded DNA-binding protein [Planktothricoides sp. SR001]MBD2545281.1 SsrA-binding protein SmpB [Planktothricoides raciborskii FACHB-1370]MBD2584347.1 SsrA-binding protein SmpB [Planktothricoides raciborskii FACHB-1261]
MAEKTQKMKLLTDNRQARFRYEILETYEAGIELKGTEVKSIIAGRANLQDAYALVRGGEVWLFNAHISPFQQASQYFNHEPRRDRKLLLHRKEINKLVGKIEQKGLTLVPLKMYMSNNKVKVALGLARGKKLHDKREDVKRRDDQRDMRRALKQY